MFALISIRAVCARARAVISNFLSLPLCLSHTHHEGMMDRPFVCIRSGDDTSVRRCAASRVSPFRDYRLSACASLFISYFFFARVRRPLFLQSRLRRVLAFFGTWDSCSSKCDDCGGNGEYHIRIVRHKRRYINKLWACVAIYFKRVLQVVGIFNF